MDFSPPYQRRGNLWTKKQKQLLIDSILNGFDIPKFYFQFMPSNSYNYAIIDGKQRIESILEFVRNEFPLSKDFEFIDSYNTKQFGSISGKYYDELELDCPALIARFWQYEISIVFMDTVNPEPINEMFVRLNSGLTVSTTEKRNANGGELSKRIDNCCNSSSFFVDKLFLSNKRFEHNDLLLKLLMIEMGFWDLTKASVDKFVIENKEFGTDCQEALQSVNFKLSELAPYFQNRDPLLRKKNIIISFYTIINSLDERCSRDFLEYFERNRMDIQRDTHPADENSPLLEFNRLLQQGADKKASIYERQRIMLEYWKRYYNNILVLA